MILEHCYCGEPDRAEWRHFNSDGRQCFKDYPDIPEHVSIVRDKYEFLVDDKPFPWYITKEGPILYQLAPELYTVRVTILNAHPFSVGDPEALPRDDRGFALDMEAWPWIQGRPFPWMITEDGWQLRSRRGDLVTLELAFFTRSLWSPNWPICSVIHETGDVLTLAGTYLQHTDSPQLPHTWRSGDSDGPIEPEAPCAICGVPWRIHILQ